MPDKPPQQVEVVAPSPVPVAVVGATPPPIPERVQDQHDATFAGQRRVNLIWEGTQAIIAISVAITVLIVAALLSMEKETSQGAFIFLTGLCSSIVTFYFVRTNHSQIGGTGDKPRSPYEGR